ncbi:transposable element Tcb2 transposase [Trichonephila clavipes]|nr:transposable element Tcb2 transposase [Trichonephila clavipes]
MPATRGLLATDRVILNHGQVTWTTPELAPPLLTTIPHQWKDVSALDRFNVHRCPTRRVFNGTGLELVTRQVTILYLYHSATVATGLCLGSLLRVPTSLNAIQYVEFMGDHLHPFTLFCYLHVNGVLQQGNCTSHKSQSATGWLKEPSCDFSVINWPPRSPDLNPIEHLWNVLKQGVKGHHAALTNLTELRTALANIWQVIPVKRFQKLFESIPRGSRYQGQRGTTRC